jgi:hypothetical protein
LRGYSAKAYFIVWTYGRFKGSVTETSLTTAPFAGADVVELAQIELRRMTAAK